MFLPRLQHLTLPHNERLQVDQNSSKFRRNIHDKSRLRTARLQFSNRDYLKIHHFEDKTRDSNVTPKVIKKGFTPPEKYE